MQVSLPLWNVSMSQLKINVLSGFEVRLTGEPILRFPTDRVRALLLLLAMQPHFTQQRAMLASLLWPEVAEKAARRNLRRCLVRLKKVLGDAADEIVVASRQMIGLDSAESDYNRFQTLRDSSNPTDWQTATLLINGVLADGFELKNSEPFDTWLTHQRFVLRQQQSSLLYKLLDITSTDPVARLRYTQQLAAIEPYEDAAHRQVMTAHAEMDNLPAAIAHYEQFAAMLRKELDTEPDVNTREQYARLVAALSKDPATLHNVPAELTPFVGRDNEVKAVLTQLQQPTCRMMTLLGAGGVGKTRLAIAISQRVASNFFNDGVYFVPLVTATTKLDVLAALHRVLALPTQGDDLEAQILNDLRHKQTLLVLDNVEQLAGKLRFLARLLKVAAGVKILATSRDVVGISAEYRYPIGGITNLHEASSLLWSAIRRITPDFELTATNMAVSAKICERLHSIPLALELAATWINTLDLDDIREEIEHAYTFLESPLLDTPDRHRSLTAVFDHSWELLTSKHQTMLAKASLFRGGFDIKAARAILRARVHDLRRLVEQSLLVKEGRNRYTLHELVRQFAAEKLTMQESDSTQRAHANYYLTLIAKHEQQLVSEKALAVSEVIAADLANITAAWRWAYANNATAQLIASVDALIHFYILTGRYSQGNQLYMETIEQFEAQVHHDRLLTRLHIGCSHFRMGQSQHDASIKSAERALNVATLVNDTVSVAESLLCKARALYLKGHQREAAPIFQQSLTACEHASHNISNGGKLAAITAIHAEILSNLSIMSAYGGAPIAAVKWADAALPIAAQSGNKLIEAFVYGAAAFSRTRVGQFTEAITFANRGIMLSRKLGNLAYESTATVVRGNANLKIGRYTEAEADCRQASQLAQAVGNVLSEVHALTQLAHVHVDASNYNSALYHSEQVVSLAERKGIVLHQAFALTWQAIALCKLEQYAAAQRTFEVIEQLRLTAGLSLWFGYMVRFGLGQIAWQRSLTEAALDHISNAVDELLIDHAFVYSEIRHYLLAYNILDANNDPRAAQILQHGYKRIMRDADRIKDPAQCQSYLEQVPHNRDFLTLVKAENDRCHDA